MSTKKNSRLHDEDNGGYNLVSEIQHQEKEATDIHQPSWTFNIVVDDVPYLVKTSPFNFNEEKRYYATVNGGIDHVFTWDPTVGRFRAIDDTSSTLPDSLEDAISQKLLSHYK